MISLGQCPVGILRREDPVEGIGHQGGYALKHRLAKRIQISRAIVVGVLAAPHAGLRGWPDLAETGDIDVETVADVDPACVDHIRAVAEYAINVVRVDIQQVLPLELGPVVGGACVFVRRHVEVLAQPFQRRGRDLGVDVPVPGHDLAVPPPA